MYITRRERFSASHRLFNKKLSATENKKIFGKCYNLHGHNYEIFVTVSGSVKSHSGFIVDLKDLKKIIQEKVISKVDHNDITEVDFMKDQITTTENLCIQIWKELKSPINLLGAKLHKIKISETENNYFEYYGQNELIQK